MVQPKTAVMLHVRPRRLTADKVTRYAKVLDKSMSSVRHLFMKMSDATRAL
jgi:hypothetical protein